MNTDLIVQRDESVLRLQANDVLPEEFGSEKLKELIHKMSSILATKKEGVAIAAPQIGVSKRIFVVAGKVFRKNDDSNVPEDKVFINPKIKKLSISKAILDEGCLSVDGYFGKILRSEKATISAKDIDGKKFTRGASGLLAQIFQHEIDHLNGILFVDTATNLEKINVKN
ncbi:MAG: peptide deformylase [Candidatus Vogelbacteria bacterium]|nr:peptide deformylase [Candidatus Vogelbacteria bacterium]